MQKVLTLLQSLGYHIIHTTQLESKLAKEKIDKEIKRERKGERKKGKKKKREKV